VEKIEAVLAEVEPASASLFKKNASLYKQKLQVLDEKYKSGLTDCAHRTFIVGGHAAFGYLARRYNLQQVALYGISPDARPTPRKLVEVIEMVRKLGINVIFFEVFISGELARTIAEQVGARTLVLNPGANLTREQLKSGTTFFDIMEKNLENLKSGLGCN
jgi:zinc transport system substrate-binding protein